MRLSRVPDVLERRAAAADRLAARYGAVVLRRDDRGRDEPGEYLRKYQYLYLEIPKKNGKSEIAAGLGTYHLFADGETNGEIYLVAADRDNAGIVFAAAKFMVESSPALKKRSRIVDSTKTIFDTVSGSKMKVLSSEAYSKHGYKRAASFSTSCTRSRTAICGTL